MEGPKVVEYVQRLHDLSRVVPYLVEPELKRMEQFIWGLAPQILSLMMASAPPTTIDASILSLALAKCDSSYFRTHLCVYCNVCGPYVIM